MHETESSYEHMGLEIHNGPSLGARLSRRATLVEPQHAMRLQRMMLELRIWLSYRGHGVLGHIMMTTCLIEQYLIS